jgi:hypothetical protein
MIQRCGRSGGAGVNPRQQRPTHEFLAIFDTLRCPLIVYTYSRGLWLLGAIDSTGEVLRELVP